jgi:uncharacterized protein
MDEQKISEFYRNWQSRLPNMADGYIYGEDKKLLPTRDAYVWLQNIVEKFLTDTLKENEKIIIMPGIRGVGKTTLLMQALRAEKFLREGKGALLKALPKLDERFYLDVSRLRLEGITLHEFFQLYEKAQGITFEKLTKKYLILLDEIHYDEHWGLFLKSMFDRTKGRKNILIIATGSSAIHLKMNPDLSRRIAIEEIYPMKFGEFVMVRHGVLQPTGLSSELRETMFSAQNAKAVYESLRAKSSLVEKFFANIPARAEDEFFVTGSFPFTLHAENRVKALERIRSVVNSIILKDVVTLKRFNTQTIGKIGSLLYLLANSDVISYEKLKNTLRIERFETLESLLEVLVASGMLVRVPSYGKTYGTTRKTPKLLFIAPALRSAILDNGFPSGIEGKKLEDYFALLYVNDLKNRFAVGLAYDFAQGGADFVVTLKDRRKVAVEIGFHKEEVRQVENTLKKIEGAYGIVFGSQKLELENESVVKIPLEYVLLM